MALRDQDTYTSQGTSHGFNDHTGKYYKSGYKAPPSAFWNAAVTYTAVCPSGYSGQQVTMTIPAKSIYSGISQEDADALALELVRNAAESQLVCHNFGMEFVSGEELFFVDDTQAEFVQPNQ